MKNSDWIEAENQIRKAYRQRAKSKFHVGLVSSKHFRCHPTGCVHGTNPEHSFLLIPVHDEAIQIMEHSAFFCIDGKKLPDLLARTTFKEERFNLWELHSFLFA